MILKAKRYGGSMYLKASPDDTKARGIEDGKFYEVVWKGEYKEEKRK